MFTGIIEEKGTISSIKHSRASLKVIVNARLVTKDVKIGDSIAVNGVCLTVTAFTASQFIADVMPETFRSTTLAELKSGTVVNLERAMAANGRFGGHFVSGHIDRVGIIERVWSEVNARYVSIAINPEDLAYLVEKGSVTVDGTSLTIFSVTDKTFVIALIPETQLATSLGERKQGEAVNLEFDLLIKYLGRLLETSQIAQSKNQITKETLERYGF
ncbi:riboflavin synthase alpha chain [Amphibacillus marinus]|uniref:Riboflavin synthase n=1 Tax=Amphibacillus marinus TaxID=872970 RepID=A0A1H8JTU9_9BACI|nr:riboflavin synthase [Amphibacillus marinus]SEN84139.1 riboflavin synthase alpha chain [Amphibacillus marinus]